MNETENFDLGGDLEAGKDSIEARAIHYFVVKCIIPRFNQLEEQSESGVDGDELVRQLARTYPAAGVDLVRTWSVSSNADDRGNAIDYLTPCASSDPAFCLDVLTRTSADPDKRIREGAWLVAGTVFEDGLATREEIEAIFPDRFDRWDEMYHRPRQ